MVVNRVRPGRPEGWAGDFYLNGRAGMGSEKHMSVEKNNGTMGFVAELRAFGGRLPHKGLFLVLLGAWLALFHYVGSGVLGYGGHVATPSIFEWLGQLYHFAPDESIGKFIPVVVLALMWWKRAALMEVRKDIWWPGLLLILFALLLHVLGYMVQQQRVSLVAFFVGLYALTGLLWGPVWMKATFFPYFLFAFTMPFNNYAERITLPLRHLATSITVAVSHVMGIDVIQQGTRILDPAGRYQYNVEVACSGLRSLTTMLALACIFAFISFTWTWKRVLLIGLAIPLAVMGNSLRLMTIVIAAENYGQATGDYVHEHWLFSLVPYIPVMIGLVLMGRWLRDEPPSGPEVTP